MQLVFLVLVIPILFQSIYQLSSNLKVCILLKLETELSDHNMF